MFKKESICLYPIFEKLANSDWILLFCTYFVNMSRISLFTFFRNRTQNFLRRISTFRFMFRSKRHRVPKYAKSCPSRIVLKTIKITIVPPIATIFKMKSRIFTTTADWRCWVFSNEFNSFQTKCVNVLDLNKCV